MILLIEKKLKIDMEFIGWNEESKNNFEPISPSHFVNEQIMGQVSPSESSANRMP